MIRWHIEINSSKSDDTKITPLPEAASAQTGTLARHQPVGHPCPPLAGRRRTTGRAAAMRLIGGRQASAQVIGRETWHCRASLRHTPSVVTRTRRARAARCDARPGVAGSDHLVPATRRAGRSASRARRAVDSSQSLGACRASSRPTRAGRDAHAQPASGHAMTDDAGSDHVWRAPRSGGPCEHEPRKAAAHR